jgi:hypothetical protein
MHFRSLTSLSNIFYDYMKKFQFYLNHHLYGTMILSKIEQSINQFTCSSTTAGLSSALLKDETRARRFMGHKRAVSSMVAAESREEEEEEEEEELNSCCCCCSSVVSVVSMDSLEASITSGLFSDNATVVALGSGMEMLAIICF